MTHFGRQVGFPWVFVGVLLVVGFLGLRWAALSEAQAQAQAEEQRRAAEEARARAEAAKQLAEKEELRKAQAEEAARRAAPVRTSHFLERGKSYYFTWQESIGPAVVLEEPRDNWVKVRTNNSEQWINLLTVHRVMPAPQAKELKDADKKAIQAQLRTLTQACETYHLNNAAWPPSLDALAKKQPNGGAPIIEEKTLLDPWGKPYNYDPAGPKNNGLTADIWVKLPDGGVLGNWRGGAGQ